MGDRRSPPLVEELIPAPDPAECCERIAGLPYRIFLDSTSTGGPLGRYSYLCADPSTVVRSRGMHTERIDVATGSATRLPGDALDALAALLRDEVREGVPELPPFQGGAAGYIGYDWGGVLETLPAHRHDDLDLSDVLIGVYDWVVAWDHRTGRAWIISTGMPETSEGECAVRASMRLESVRSLLATAAPTGTSSDKCLSASSVPRVVVPPAPSHIVPHGEWSEGIDLRTSFTRDEYLAAVRRVRDYICAGDVFQVNLSQRFEAPLDEPAWDLYRRLRTGNPAPFAAYLDFPEVTVLSVSPERFLRVTAAGQVETRPIKGTRPRGLDPVHDAALGRALLESEKDRAENLMIVDLLRNDLSRVCAPSSVRVPELFALEQHPTVHHLVSTVVGTLAPGQGIVELLRATFPGGSITGAPKVRAMQIIAELEPSHRGVYSGSIGYWSVTGAMDANIAIRTGVVKRGRIYFNAGGGIVADSDPEQEYRETLDKARGLISALERDG